MNSDTYSFLAEKKKSAKASKKKLKMTLPRAKMVLFRTGRVG